MLAVRKASREDITVIRDLAHRIWPDAYKDILDKARLDYMLDLIYSLDSLQLQMEHSGHHFLLLHQKDEAIGFASFSEKNLAGNYHLHKLYVLTSHQGTGSGKFLLNAVIDEIKSRNARQLDLNVNRSNKARFFYEKLGFEIIKEEDIDIGNGYFMNDYVMSKTISG